MPRTALILLSAILLLSIVSCGKTSAPIMPDQATNPDIGRTITYIPSDYCGELGITDLIAGQNMDLGDVTVSITEDYLYFDVTLSAAAVADGWVITETHTDVYTNLADFPLTKKGNPKVGQYAYDIDSSVISIWEPGTVLYLSVHASLEKIVDGDVVQSETGWADGTEFPGKSWAMYFTYTVPECWKAPPLPPAGSLLDVKIYSYPGATTYFDLNLTNVPVAPEGDDPYEVWDGIWPTWCADKHHLIYYNQYYDFEMYSSYDYDNWSTGLQTYMDTHGPNGEGVEWDKINWILNNKGTYTAGQIQDAIWWFTDGYGTQNALALLADQEGAGFLPGAGELMALILYKPGVQIIFSEVDP